MNLRHSITSVHDTYLPIYRLSMSVGFACFARQRRQFCAQTSWHGIALVLLNIGVLITDICIHSLRESSNEVNLLVLGNQYSTYSFIVSILIGHLTAIYRRRRFGGILQQLQHIDKQLAILGEAINHRAHYRVVVAGCICVLLHAFAIGSSAIWLMPSACPNNSTGIALEMVSYAYFSLAYAATMGNIVCAYQAIRVRLAVLNRRIGAIDRQTSLATAKLMSRTYEELNGVCDAANASFSLLVLASIAFALISNTVCMFTIYILLPNTAKMTTFVVSQLFWNCSTLVWLLLLAHTGHTMVKVSRQTGRTIHRVVNADDIRTSGCDPMQDMDRQLGHFSRQTLQCYPVASCGLFTLDWTMVHVINVTSITYLIFMLQFMGEEELQLLRNSTALEIVLCET